MRIDFAKEAFEVGELGVGLVGIRCWTDEQASRELTIHVSSTWMCKNRWEQGNSLTQTLEEHSSKLSLAALNALDRGSKLLELLS